MRTLLKTRLYAALENNLISLLCREPNPTFRQLYRSFLTDFVQGRQSMQ